jgi:hypothetical protein
MVKACPGCPEQVGRITLLREFVCKAARTQHEALVLRHQQVDERPKSFYA